MKRRKNTTSKSRRRIRYSFLMIEILFVMILVFGGSYLVQKRESSSKVEKNSRKEEELMETPDFSWDGNRIIAHALGEMDGKTYLNSMEGFQKHYEKGVRLFEVDLAKTSDGVWVCRHGWKNPMGQWEGEKNKILTAEEFKSRPLYGTYTPMTLKDLFLLLKEYPDAFVLLDAKQYSVRNYMRTVEDYVEYIETAREAGAEEVLDQLIPEIYNEAMFAGTSVLYDFPSCIYSLWEEYSIEEIRQIGDFCKEKQIPAVTVYEKYWTEEVQDIFDKRGILVYVYTINDKEKARSYLQAGAEGVCTDRLSESDLDGENIQPGA